MRFGYVKLGKRDKGVVLKFLLVATGLSHQQMERLVRQWRETGAIRGLADSSFMLTFSLDTPLFGRWCASAM